MDNNGAFKIELRIKGQIKPKYSVPCSSMKEVRSYIGNMRLCAKETSNGSVAVYTQNGYMSFEDLQKL